MTEGKSTIMVTPEATTKNIVRGDLRAVFMSIAQYALTPSMITHTEYTKHRMVRAFSPPVEDSGSARETGQDRKAKEAAA